MPGLPAVIYGLCFIVSGLCAALLVRSYLRNRTRLLLWSAACFVLLAVNNLFVVVDLVVLPNIDLNPLRLTAGLAAICTLLFGFVWELD